MHNTGTIRLVAREGLNPVRLTLCIADVGFDDEPLSRAEAERGQESELQVNGESLVESGVMLRCAGRLGGSYPVTSPFIALQIDEILHVLCEVEAKINYPEESLDADRDARQKELETSTIPRYASLIEARLQRLRDVPAFECYSVKVLIHEVALYCWAKRVRDLGLDGEVDKHNYIVEAESKVENHPNVKQLRTQRGDHPTLKLTYFPFPGRAEPIRLALFIAGIDFEDERIGVDELNFRRSTLPFNQLPVLEVDGEVVSQALGILRYVGTLGGLYSPTDTKEAFRIDEVFSLIDEFYSSYAWNASYFEKGPVEQMLLRILLAEKRSQRR